MTAEWVDAIQRWVGPLPAFTWPRRAGKTTEYRRRLSDAAAAAAHPGWAGRGSPADAVAALAEPEPPVRQFIYAGEAISVSSRWIDEAIRAHLLRGIALDFDDGAAPPQ